MTTTQFKITVCSDPNYEDLIAEIYYGDDFVGLVSQEHGYDSLDIELHAAPSGRQHKLKLSELEEVLKAARQRLYDLRRTSGT